MKEIAWFLSRRNSKRERNIPYARITIRSSPPPFPHVNQYIGYTAAEIGASRECIYVTDSHEHTETKEKKKRATAISIFRKDLHLLLALARRRRWCSYRAGHKIFFV